MNHRDAGAFEKRSPSEAEWKRQQEAAANPTPPAAAAPKQKTTAPSGTSAPKPAPSPGPSTTEEEILVVVSKVKSYIREKSGMNTSEAVMQVLSAKLRAMADDAIRRATQDERKTVLDRDIR